MAESGGSVLGKQGGQMEEETGTCHRSFFLKCEGCGIIVLA